MSAEPDPTVQVEPEVRVPLSIERVAAALAMAALCVITFGNVVARYLTNYSFAFTEEYSIALMVVVTMLGASLATAGDQNIRVTWFVDHLRPASRRWAEVIATSAIVAMFGLLILLGGRVVWDEYRFEVTSPGLGEPQWIYTLTLPLLAAAVVGRAIGHLVRTWRGRVTLIHDRIEPV